MKRRYKKIKKEVIYDKYVKATDKPFLDTPFQYNHFQKEQAIPRSYARSDFKWLRDTSKKHNKNEYALEKKFKEATAVLFQGRTVYCNYPVLNKYFADFLLVPEKIIFELDEVYHIKIENKRKDNQRDCRLFQGGYTVIRLSEQESVDVWREKVTAALQKTNTHVTSSGVITKDCFKCKEQVQVMVRVLKYKWIKKYIGKCPKCNEVLVSQPCR